MDVQGRVWMTINLNINLQLYLMDDSNPAFIVDSGSGFVKMGLAGDDAPKSYFPTIIGKPKQPGQMIGMDQKDIYIGHEVTSKQGVLDLSRPIVDGIIVNMADMEKMWHHGFFNELQMTPEDSPILLTETPGNSKKNRQDLIQAMFQKFNVSSFYLALQQVLALYASGKTTGVVLDSGYSLTSTVPIYEGFALSHAIQKMNLAGKHLTDYLVELMKDDGISFSNSGQQAARFNARDTKEKVCYVAADFEGSLKEFSENPNKSIVHKLPDGNEIQIKSQAFKCPEALFQPSKIVGKELLGAHQLTFQSILKCDSDIRKDLYGNIVIAGGTSMLKNLKQRLQKEVIALAPSTMKINVFDPPERKFSSWMGGSILASLSSFSPMFITKQEYQENGASYVHRKCF